MKQQSKRTRGCSCQRIAVVIIVVMVFSGLGFYLTQLGLKKSALNPGNEVSSCYTAMELEDIRFPKGLLKIGVGALEKQVEAETSFKKLQHWVETFFQKQLLSLRDTSGEPLYAKNYPQVGWERPRDTEQRFFAQIKAGNLDNARQYIYDLADEKPVAYSSVQSNDGAAIITNPHSALLGTSSQAFYGIMVVCGIFLLLLVFLSAREYQMRKKLFRVSQTVAALGNLYYSIYRVNWANGTYEAIKISQDLVQRIPPKGPYDQLLEAVGQLIDQDTFAQFKTSFSLENMRELVKRNNSDFGGDFRRLFGDEYRWVNVRLLFSTGQPNEAILCFRQVDREKTQQLKQLQILENALDQAKESEAARGQFFSQMSHDMRTPLNVIIGTTQLAQRQKNDQEAMNDYLKKIQVSANHLLELINDILEIARMEKTDLRLKNDPCDLQETVSQCLATFQTQADLQRKTLKVRFDLTHQLVYADAFRLQQVLNNLVSNAMKFTDEGDCIQVEVSQPSRQDDGICRIVVQDTGIGMSEDFLPRLFTPYARESRFGTQTVLGTGLGMTIVKTIISRMKGQIQVESAPGKGTKFILTIPMEPVPQEKQSTAAEEPLGDPTEILCGKQVLLAEDFEMNLEIGTELLKLCGAEVTQARNGREAVEIFQASPPGKFDVILMDVNMPVMDGCAAAMAIRAMKREDATSIPILAVTANAFAEDVAATARAGMNAHITKPIDIKQLAEALRGLGQ